MDALRKGLLQVVPEAVLQLLTLKEFEERICGKADIPIEALEKNSTSVNWLNNVQMICFSIYNYYFWAFHAIRWPYSLKPHD